MKELVEDIAKTLVEHPDQVQVNEIEKESGIVLELSVAPEDMGKVIGKRGRIAHAIRVVLKAYATKNGKKVSLDIV